MKRLLGWYGAGPLHLLSLLACFALAGYAAAQLVPSRPLGVAVWFLGAVIGHDLLLVPLYSLADRSAGAVFRHRAPGLPAVAWVNYVRVPAALSGLLLLIWFPLIFRLTAVYHASTTLSADPYVWHWLAVTGALFLLSAVAFAIRLRGTPEYALPAEGEGQAHSASGEAAGGATAREIAPADDGPRGDDRPSDGGSVAEREHTTGHGPPGSGKETPQPVPERGAGDIPREIAPEPAATVREPAGSVKSAPQQTAPADPGAAGAARDQPDQSTDGCDGEGPRSPATSP
jgi:hypothetical protein